MSEVFSPILQFLPWCWTVNISLTVLGYVTRKSAFVSKHDQPFDCELKLPDGNRILGTSTTLFGLIFVIVEGLFGEYLWPNHYLLSLSILVYAGHALGSFIKRRFAIPDGAFLPGIDHGDYVLTTGLFLYLIGTLSFLSWLLAWILTLILTPFITVIAFRLKVRKEAL
jgi:hypothetical protein